MNKTLRLLSLQVSKHLRCFRLFLLTLLLCGFIQAMAETWTDSNGITWSFTVNGTEATDIRYSSGGPNSEKIYIYGENPEEQPPFQPDASNAAAMRFSDSEGYHFPYLTDEVYWGYKTLIIDVSDATDDLTVKVMSGWWDSVNVDDQHWISGLNELQLTEDIAKICAKGNGGKGHDLTLMVTSGTCKVNAVYYETFSNPETVVEIPAKVYVGSTELTVTSIGYRAFGGCSVKSVTIPSSVTSIGERAFTSCTLSSINIPNSVKSIGYYAFSDCSGLKKVIAPDIAAWCGITFNDEKANPLYYAHHLYSNEDTEITELTIPNGVTGIGDNAFQGCYGLTSVTIPNSVTSIGWDAFNGCSNLAKVNVHVTNYTTFCNNTIIGDLSSSIGKPVTLIDNDKNEIKEFIIPDDVTSIGSGAFRGCTGLTSVTIPNSVTSIGDNAFSWCSGLTSIEIPNSVTNIGSGAFSNCSGLTSIEIPNSVTSIGSSAFRGCSRLTSIEIPNSVTSIGDNAFSGCDLLTSVEIPNSVTSIGSGAFRGCSRLTSIEIPNSVTSIGYEAFSYCSRLTSVTIPNSVTSIGWDAFRGCSRLTSVNIFDLEAWCKISFSTNYSNPLSYAHHLFLNGAEVKDLVIPNSVTSIGDEAFYGCSGLTSIEIPNSVTSIGDEAFYGCSGLTSIEIPNSVTNIGREAFYGTAWYDNQPDGLVYAGKVAYKYKGTMPTNTSITINEGTLVIGREAFYGCSGLTSIEIPNSVTSIGHKAFYGCSGLTSVTIGKNVTSIGNYAFSDCSGLTSVEIPNSVTSIGDDAFYGCSGLTSIEIPNSVTSIGDNAFSWCSGLTSIEIPNSVTSIDDEAFYGCNRLTSVTLNSNSIVSDSRSSLNSLKTVFGDQVTEYIIGEDVTSIGHKAFYGCSGLTSVTIGKNVTSIDDEAFYGCSGLTSVTLNSNSIVSDNWFNYNNSLNNIFGNQVTEYIIGEDVTSIGDNAFSDCNNLTKVKVRVTDYTTFCNNTIIRKLPSIIPIILIDKDGNEIKKFIIPDDVTSIGSGAFRGCSGLTSVTIPNSVTSIGSGAFRWCSGLTSVTIPNSVTSIGNEAFASSGLTSVNIFDLEAWCNISFEGANANPLSYAHHLFLNGTEIKDLLIPNSVTSIGGNAFSGCSGLTSVEIPNSVTSIGDNAFSYCSGLTSVNIFDLEAWCNISFEGANANPLSYAHHLFLNGTEIKDLLIPNSVTSIGGNAFSGCSGLTSVEIPNSVTSIGDDAFSGCSGLTSIEIPNSVTSIGDYAFSGCSSLTSLNIPSSVNSLGYGAFHNTGWFEKQSDGILYLDNWLLGYKGDGPTGELVINEGTKGIAVSALSHCSGLTSVMIPNSMKSISSFAFQGCSDLTSVTIGNSVTSIGEWAFFRCDALTSVTIPSSVTSIGGYAFYYCSSLKELFCYAMTPPACYHAFEGIDKEACSLYVPKGCMAAYEAADVWKDFKEIVEIEHPEYQMGDADGDGKVDVNDVTSTINYILKKPVQTFIKDAADMDGDGVIDVNDVQGIIDKALGK